MTLNAAERDAILAMRQKTRQHLFFDDEGKELSAAPLKKKRAASKKEKAAAAAEDALPALPPCPEGAMLCAAPAGDFVLPEPVVVPAALAEKKEVNFYSLLNTQKWKKNWHKCFDREVKIEGDVRPGDTGSIGIGYGIHTSLSELIAGKTKEEAIAALIAATPNVPHTHKKLSKKQCTTAVLPFYELATSENGKLFGLKQGTTAYWVVEKIGDYYHAPPADRASAPLVSDWQNTENYFEHRFSFRVVAVVQEAERKMPHHLDLMKKYSVTF